MSNIEPKGPSIKDIGIFSRFLNSRPVYCSQLYGNLFTFCDQGCSVKVRIPYIAHLSLTTLLLSKAKTKTKKYTVNALDCKKDAKKMEKLNTNIFTQGMKIWKNVDFFAV